MTKPRSSLYRAARALGDLEAISSGDSRKMVRRGKNKLLGRLLSIFRVWR